MNIRLFDWQVERIKKGRVSGAAILKQAFRRYQAGELGEIVVQNDDKKEKGQNVPHLEGYSIRSRFPVSDAVMREILRRHWEKPDLQRAKELETEIKELNKEIDEYFRTYSGTEYIQK